MKDFAELFRHVDQTTKTNAKVAALAEYFATATEDDKLWTIALFTGRRPKRTVTSSKLREWAADAAGIPLWLFEDSYSVVGDLAETISLVLPEAKGVEDHSLTYWISRTKSFPKLEEDDRKTAVLSAWTQLPNYQRFLFNKLLTGGFRVGVSAKLVTRALSQTTGQDAAVLTHKLMGQWTPDTTTWQALIEDDDPQSDLSKPYPFYLAHALDNLDQLSDPTGWNAERKWDGIRGQLIVRQGEHYIWSRGEDLMTDRFPELAQLKDFVPDGTVIDGEILAFRDGAPLSFNALQKRIGRKTVPKKLLAEAPVVLMAYDLLEDQGRDIREVTFAERRNRLEKIIKSAPDHLPLHLSSSVPFDSWDHLAKERDRSRDLNAEGLMLKRLDSPYLSGRKRGDWWKWKIDPLTIDAVMIYAQAGHGRRANLFTDYTFAVWNGNELTPFTKAYSGLTDAEFREITSWVRKNTLQRFGPVRQVPPHHVFEIAFEGIQASPRHKSGVALRFPRMLRWRKDKPVAEANTLADLKEMLEPYG
ncbi:DNA ligase-1 [Cognatiyoonia sediminum]|uniref:DNA ligase (ATP) n=1 Tax=Cognatiyoonia sediminum TaxID=1508389 RepID=A0A1M5N0A8_9RHOB|nr:ATP-dependent DNA ligase [Cognatiyoonia sediminum]SHG82978.1 DNA ligase-1 [Cognatiyoonia sediminum]